MQQIAVITLGIGDIARSRRFYVEGFGWRPVFENAEIVFYQMNGLMLGTWLESALAADIGGRRSAGAGAYALGHNVPARADVAPLCDRLLRAGGAPIRDPLEPPHGGLSAYVADPDGHIWEIAWNPAWTIDARGWVTFGV